MAVTCTVLNGRVVGAEDAVLLLTIVSGRVHGLEAVASLMVTSVDDLSSLIRC